MRKFICLALALCMIMSFTACGSKNEPEKTQDSGNSTVTGTQSSMGQIPSNSINTVINGYDYGDTGGISLPISKEPITIKFFIQEHPSTPFNKDWVIWNNLEEATNIKFDFMPVGASAFEEKMKLLYSTGDLPDLVETRLTFANQFGVQGGIANVLDYLKVMPNFSKYLENHPEAKSMITTDNGGTYYLPVVGTPKYQKTWLYRGDTFKKNNITPPTNTEELYNVLKKLKEIYPNDYPFISRNGITTENGIFGVMARQWNTGYNVYFDYDADQWKFGPTDENYKKMLIFLNKLYKEKLLDPEWATLATKQWEDKIINGQGFVTIDWIYRIDTMRDAGTKANPEWSLDGMMPIVEKGLGEPKLIIRSDSSETDGFLVPEYAKNKEEIFKLLDFMYSPAGELLTNFGKLGDTAAKDADGHYNWSKEIKSTSNPDGQNPYDAYYGFQTLGSYTSYSKDWDLRLYSSEQFQTAYKMYEDNNCALPPLPTLKFTDDEKTRMAELETPIRDFCDAQCATFVNKGNFEDWDTYVNKVRNMNVDELVKLYNDVYARSK